jgi:glycine dehydrogenase subunit 1
MNYTPHTKEEISRMLKDIKVKSIEDLFKDIPKSLRPKSFEIPEGKSEFEVIEHLKKLASKNAVGLINFLGAGFYDHYVPSAVNHLASRSEFYTAYTPYQPECSQGWLQSIYEYQTAICELTDMEVSNASLYDGGTALYEAAMMAVRITGRNKIIVDSGVSLIYRSMLYTYTSNLSVEFVEIPVLHGRISRDDIKELMSDDTAAVILQNPNFFGAIDDHSDIIDLAHSKGILAIESVYPISLGLLKTPGAMGADIVTGEGQSLGNYLSFGGPYLGFLGTKKQFVRNMPGRIVGKTEDVDENPGYVLTLQTREQHIRRQRATSNICSNEALCALRAVIYLSLMGKTGLEQLAQLIYDKTEFAKDVIDKIPGVQVKRSSPTFNEFTVYLPVHADEVINKMVDKGFAAGFPLGRYYKGMDNYLLVSITEKRTKEDIVKYAESLEAVLCD